MSQITSLPRAMLLDMDDTILDDSGHVAKCLEDVCDRFAPRRAGLEAAALATAFRASADWYWSDPQRHRAGRLDLQVVRRLIMSEALERLGHADGTLAAELAAAYSELREAGVRPLPGAIETVARLREAGVRLALLTNGNGQSQRRKIEQHGLAGYFDCIVIEGEFGRGKPEVEVYQHALAALGVTPADAWMVGDNLEWEVIAPQRLGIYGIWVDGAGRGLPVGSPARPDRIIRSLAELI